MGTALVSSILILAVGLSIRKLIQDRKKGRNCCGNCSRCTGCGYSGSDSRRNSR